MSATDTLTPAEAVQQFEEITEGILRLERELAPKLEELNAAEAGATAVKLLRNPALARAIITLRVDTQQLQQTIKGLSEQLPVICPAIAFHGLQLERENAAGQRRNIAAVRAQIRNEIGRHFEKDMIEGVIDRAKRVCAEQAALNRLPACLLAVGFSGENNTGDLILHPDVKLDRVLPNYRALAKAGEEVRARAEAIKKAS